MSFGFLACAGPEAALADLEARLSNAPDLVLRVRGSGVRFWADPSAPFLRGEDGRAILIGFLLDRASGRRLTELGAAVRVDRKFMSEHWGAYVLIQGEADGALTALRDPSGTVPAFYGSEGRLQLFASGPELLQLARGPRWQPDVQFIRHWLTFPFLRTARTGVEGIRELLPGCSISGCGEPDPLWSPWSYTEPLRPTDFAEAARALRKEALRSIPALIPDDADLALQLSGGLDSSIIAASLANAGRSFKAITFATRAADGDERRYAREAAGRFGIELIEIVEQATLPDFSKLPAPAFRPPQTALLQPYERLVTDQLRALGARWAVNGAGGDNLFASLNTAGPAVDAFRLGGFEAAAAAIGDLAAIHNTTRWHVLQLAWRKAGKRRSTPWQREERFLKADVVLAGPDPHPWLPPDTATLPGKREHVLSLIGIQHFIEQQRAGSSGLYPLMSQPLLELCLSIPTHLWIAGGRDRAVAREAFRGLVPDPILARRWKGRLESMFMTGYMQGRKQIEALLLDGELRAHGIIDTESICAYLREPKQPQDAGYTRILELAAAESWLRSLGS